MGMFDSLYDKDGLEYQTKALGCVLDRYELGDKIKLDQRDDLRDVVNYQMKLLGNGGTICATVTNSRLTVIPASRDELLPLLDYFGGWLA